MIVSYAHRQNVVSSVAETVKTRYRQASVSVCKQMVQTEENDFVMAMIVNSLNRTLVSRFF